MKCVDMNEYNGRIQTPKNPAQTPQPAQRSPRCDVINSERFRLFHRALSLHYNYFASTEKMFFLIRLYQSL